MHCPPLDFEFFSLSAIILLSGIVLCARELVPSTQLAYSKFANHQQATVIIIFPFFHHFTSLSYFVCLKIPSRLGMIGIYLPSWVVSLLCLSTAVSHSGSYGQLLIVTASFLHYTKRLLV